MEDLFRKTLKMLEHYL